MAESERLGASFSIDVSALKAGLSQANRLIRESNSEFKAAAAGLDDWSSSEEGLTAKLKNLNEVADLQSKKVEAMQKEYEKCIADGLDPMSAAAVKMRTDLNNEKAALEKTKSEIGKYEDALDDLSDASEDAGNNVEDLGDSAKESSDGFTIAKGAIADLISNGIQNLVGACKDAIGSIWGLAESTKESRVAFAKLNQSFDTAGLGAKAAEKTMSDLYGVLGDTDKATEASNLLAKMSKDQNDLDKNTRILTGVFAEFGDSIPTEGLAEGMQATAAMGTVQGVLADALEWQGINLDEYNEKLASMSSEEERATYIQDTLTGLYGESADAYRENNSALIEANEAQLDYDKTMSEFGAKIEPITTKVKEGFNKILEKVLELVDGVDFDAFGATIEKAFDKFTNDILPKIIDGFTWIKDNGDTIIAVLGGIAAGFAAFKVASLIQGVVGAIKAFQLANEGATVAQALLNSTMLANPMTWVAVGIAALVAGIILLIKNWDKVKEVAVACWDKIKEIWGKVAGWFDEHIINPVKKVFSGMWDTLKNGAKNAWEGIKNVFSKVATFFGDTFKKAWEKVKAVFSVGGKIFDGIKDGIVSAFKTVVNAIIKGINKVVALPFNGLNKILNTLQNIEILGIKPFEWISWRAPVPEIPLLARGGVVRKATTAVIGEDGAEAVVPLEKNTEWIDKVAEKLASKQSSVVVNQTNNYSQAHSRYEIYKSKQQTVAAVRLALQGV